MKKIVIGIIAIATILVISGCMTTSDEALEEDQNAAEDSGLVITIDNLTFDPALLTVKEGDIVEWINEDNTTHTVTGKDFESGDLETNDAFTFTFQNKGEYDYTCSIHPSMKGKIVVE